MDAPPITWLLVNSASGSNDEDTVARLGEALEAAGRAPGRLVSLPDDELPTRAELERSGVGLLTVFTGDGTVNAAVTGLYGWAGQVLVLPGGTQNLLARACHGECVATEIIERLGNGDLAEAHRPIIRCSQGDALCEIVAGPGAIWSDVREAMREANLAQFAASVREAIAQSAAGPMVSVGEPPLGKPEGYSAVRLHPLGDAIAIDGYGAEGLADYARHGLALVKRDFREGPHDELGTARAVTCRCDGSIELMIDGERYTGASEERFELLACDVTFLVSPETLRLQPAGEA
jgi:diacylglycerol kinase family enzyme